jgi:hypothetical protein
MKKPLNRVAVALWILAAIVPVAEGAQYAAMIADAKSLAVRGDTIGFFTEGIVRTAFAAILPAAQLAAMGVLIDLVDQIRWNALCRP